MTLATWLVLPIVTGGVWDDRPDGGRQLLQPTAAVETRGPVALLRLVPQSVGRRKRRKDRGPDDLTEIICDMCIRS